MRFFISMLVLGFIAVGGITGCKGGDPEVSGDVEALLSPMTPGQLVEEFTRMARDPETHEEGWERLVLITQLSAMGPKTLTPIIEMMAAPESSGKTRIFVLQSLAGRMSPLYMDDLSPLVDSEDPVIRACAISLLGHIDHADAMPLLVAARSDEDSRVSFSALSSMAVMGDEAARNELRGMYFVDDARIIHKREVVRVVLRKPEAGDLKILKSALVEEYLDDMTRSQVAVALGQLGDASAIGPLQKSLEQYTSDPIFTDVASNALKLLKTGEAEISEG